MLDAVAEITILVTKELKHTEYFSIHVDVPIDKYSIIYNSSSS